MFVFQDVQSKLKERFKGPLDEFVRSPLAKQARVSLFLPAFVVLMSVYLLEPACQQSSVTLCKLFGLLYFVKACHWFVVTGPAKDRSALLVFVLILKCELTKGLE